jgi:primosomal protein N'
LANRFVDGLTSIRDSSGFAVDVLGPTSAHPHTLNGKYRWQVVLRGDTPMEILLKVDVPIDAIVDVDPIEVN